MDDTRRTALKDLLNKIFHENSKVSTTDLSESIGNRNLFGNVPGVERNVVVTLYDVENRNGISSGQQSVDNVTAQKSTATDYEVDVL